jgi:hypothetical protein
MLALLSAPRGRVSAARIAARLKELRAAEPHRVSLRLPRAPTDDTPGRPLPPIAPHLDGRP